MMLRRSTFIPMSLSHHNVFLVTVINMPVRPLRQPTQNIVPTDVAPPVRHGGTIFTMTEARGICRCSRSPRITFQGFVSAIPEAPCSQAWACNGMESRPSPTWSYPWEDYCTRQSLSRVGMPAQKSFTTSRHRRGTLSHPFCLLPSVIDYLATRA